MKSIARNLIIAAAVTWIVIATTLWLLNRPTRIGSHAYDYATALHSICHHEDSGRLGNFVEAIRKARESDQITAKELALLHSIATHAEVGNWKSARARSRKLLEDQVQRP